MKKKLSFLMALVAMFLCTNGAWAETLYFAFGGGTASDALDGGANQTWTSNEHAGYSWAITGNTAKGISGANKVNAAPYYDGNLTTFKNSNGAQNTFYMPEGVKICNIKFIGYTNALESEGTCTLKEINGVDVTENNTIAVYKDDATMVNKVLGTPGVIDYTFPEPVSGSFTFTMAGKQGCFIIVIETIEQEAEDNNYTGAIVNADLSTTDAWNTEGTKGISGGVVKVGSGSIFDFSQTITLPAGQYKMTAQAAYRYSGAEQAEYEAIVAGTETRLAKLYAETSSYKYEVAVQNRYDGASDTDYAAGDGSVTVNGKYVPNSSAAVQVWFNNGQYVNELVFNVQEEGQVKIGIAKTESPEAGDYANIGAWTLIRLGDAEADPEKEEPVPETSVYTMVQNEADLVAGGKYLIMAEVNGGWVALSDLSGKIRVPSDTLAMSENYTVETVVATAISEAPAIFAGAAYELTLEGEPGAWKFKDELNGAYLHWSSGNYLINDAEGSAWAIAFNQYAHNAVITHAVTTERVLQYNASAPRFCAYTSVQKPVYLFKAGEVTVAPVAPSNPSFNTIAELLAFEVGNMVDLNVNNAKITYLSGNNMSITDGTDTLAIYDYNIPADYVLGGFLSGKITATLGEYKGNKQLTVVDWSEVTFVEPPYFADGDYLIVNTETGYYLGGGNDWGTHASLLGKPQFFTFAHQGNNAYTLDSHQSNGGDSHYLATGLYCDGAAANWTFAKNENGNYTINNGGNYLAGNGTNKVIVTVTEVTAAAEWTIISRAEAFAALDAATVEAPADATIYINNPECKRNAGGWTVTSADGTGTPSNYALGGGGNTANCAESYHSTNGFDLSQVLVGMKPGVYRLDGHAFYRNDGDNTGAFPYFYVNDQQSRFPELTGSENSMAAAYASFLNGSYPIAPIYFTVAEGDEVKIGVHGDNTAFWNIWGELGLTYYGADASIAEVKASSVYAEYKAAIDKPMNAEVLATMEAAKAAYEADSSEDNLAAFTAAVSAATASVNAYANSKVAIDAMFALMESTNVYTAEAYATYKAKAEDFLAQYEARTLAVTVDNPAAVHGHRAAVDYDDLLLSAFGVKDYDTDLYINTWSVEGETDGTEFKVPFFEYWTGDDASLGATTKTATVTGLTPGQAYEVEVWVRTRAKNGVAAADATGITLSVGDGEAVDVTEGVVVGTSQFAHAVYTAVGAADENGNLTINFNVLADNNVSWLSFKNLKYTEVEMLTVVGAKVGEVALVEGVATVESISTIDVTFDRPVALAEGAGWATLADSWGPTNLKAEVLAENANVVRFTVSDEFGGEFTEAGDYILNIPAGFIVDAENSDCGNAEITATITIEAAPAVPLTVTNVTVGEDVMADLSVIVATPADMIKVNFDGQFYFQGMPTIVDAEGNDASNYFQYLNGLDFDGSNSYIFMAQNWEGVAAPAGIYTITLPKASFMEMMQWKAPAEDIVLTVQIVAGKKVIYDLNVERVAGLGYAAEDYTIATSELAALLGVESLGEATIWGVNPDGSYVADAMAAYDGWRAVDGTFAGCSSETAAVCVKLFAEEAAYLISICTHGDNGNDPAAGTQSSAVWALVAGIDTVVINTNITFIEPAIINIADFEVVSTITVKHVEEVGVAFSGNTASFDAAAVAAALGVTSLNDAEQYILNVTTGNLVVNSTDGWRNSQGDATAWGSLDEGSVCVKINDPASGTIDYIGCYDATYEYGEVYTAKWAFVHEGKAVVIEVVIIFETAGIDNIEALENAVIYTISGKRVQGDVKSLERGIYIINGVKTLVK